MSEVDAIIARLGLAPHPEGGFYRETFRAPASTAIYFLLPAGTFSALHRVRDADEAWHFYDGDPLDLHTIEEDGTHTIVRLGRDLTLGERPQAIVRAGVWQAAVPLGRRYTLCGCTVAPAFDFASFEMPARHALQRRFPQHVSLISRLTR